MRIISLVLVIIVILCAGTLLYFFFIQGEKTPWQLSSETEQENNVESGDDDVVGVVETVTVETAASELPEQSLLVDTDITGAKLDPNGDSIWFYDRESKQIAQVNLKGEKLASVPAPANYVEDIVWSPDTQSFLYQSGENKYYYREREGGEEILLGSNIESPVFVNANEIWYRFIDPDRTSSAVRVGDPSAGLSGSQEVMPAGSSLVLKCVPNTNGVAYYLWPNENVPSAVYSLDQSGNKQLVVSKGSAMEAVWSPDGSSLAYTKTDNGRLQLFVANGEGKNPRQLDRSTFIDKIAFSQRGKTIYLAVPKLVPSLTDYLSGEAEVEDELYRYDIESGELTKIADLGLEGEKIGARQLFLSQNGKLLYFINSYNGALYVVNLSKLSS